MSGKLTVIKLGGALLTDKERPFTLRRTILQQAAAEVSACRKAGLIDQLFLIHGVGSFGHPPVVQHKLHKGFQSAEQLIHLTFAQNSVMKLRSAVAEAFHAAGIPVSTIFPSSCMTATKGKLRTAYLDAAAGFLQLGMVPLMGGDVLVDDEIGFSVYGGDKIAVDLALHFGAIRLIFATDVDGIYDCEPKQFPNARPIPRFTLGTGSAGEAQLGRNQQADASGAMAGKLTAVLPARDAIQAGLRVHIISMLEKGRLSALLRDEQACGTLITV